jgi:hypothetical protein
LQSGAEFENIKIHNFSSCSSILTVNIKNTIPKKTSYVKSQKAPGFANLKFGVMNAKASQAADKLIQSPAKALSQGRARDAAIKDKFSGFCSTLSIV